jgi:hypothetical protein
MGLCRISWDYVKTDPGSTSLRSLREHFSNLGRYRAFAKKRF